MDKVLRCGHEWAIALTEQLDDSDLDDVYQCILEKALHGGTFGLWLNRTFVADLLPSFIYGHELIHSLDVESYFERAANLPLNQIFFTRKGLIVLPIRHKEKTFGIVCISSMGKLEDTLLVVLAYLSSVYINQLATLRHARLDPLTELLNRQTFEQKVVQIMAGSGFNQPRGGQPERTWFLAMIDIDHFKSVNDNYGHVIGDEVILMVAQLLKQNFRAEDYVFRYGGEEFATLFQCVSETAAMQALERLREVVSAHRFPQVGRVTVSLGFVEVRDFCQVTSLVNRADMALYESKHQGRNRVTAFTALNLPESQLDDSDIELF
ncbi:GGDEF domain-containing protein [Pseudoalteromonas xiamenensis]|uniref:GGDEF domain-containing protein n=1 Tax=Pseudoalteromonas xiamenensis TaxID=882626 RepID=UPI0027E534E9|nr:GGDEF domain-containing protein [Pseudoalteromonas xiamenensis]WMN61025.1 GGDEF domain-containing protein [Pseudoalteromonas xiamenensis]